MTDKYDIVIIGGGLGGLECGVTLSKEGYRVCVLEKNASPGGCFQSFYQDGRLLDAAIHYVGSMDEGQMLYQYFKYFGILDKLKIQRLDSEAFEVVCYQGQQYAYAMDEEAFVEGLAQHFPSAHEHLRQYVCQLKEVGDQIGVEQLRRGILSSGGMEYFARSAWQEIRKIIPYPVLQQVLAGTNLLYGGRPDRSTFYHHAMVNYSNLKGAYRFSGGSRQVTDALAEVIRQEGGTVICRSQVNRIVTEGEKVTAVEMNGGERIETRYVISAIHPRCTLEMLDENQRMRKAYISRIQGMENSYGMFTAYLMMKKDSFLYQNRNYYLYEGADVWYTPEKESRRASCLLSMTSKVFGDRYADVVSLTTPMYINELHRWDDTNVGKRGTDYEDFKAERAEELIALAGRWFPDLKANIEGVFTTTPLSFRDFTATIEGSAYGVVKDFHRPLATLISPRTKIENLLLTGQNLNVHGALGVTLTAMLTCAELLGKEYLAKKIGMA